MNFTYEVEERRKLTFLDVLVTRERDSLSTSVHTKTTNSGDCINFSSIAPERYKIGVIKTFLHRAYTVSSSWNSFHCEVKRIKQLLTNNNYPMLTIEREIKNFLDRKFAQNITPSNDATIELFYQSQMSSLYKQEEQSLQRIVHEHVRPLGNSKIMLHIYYKSMKMKNLFIRNNPHSSRQSSHVAYRYRCNHQECQLQDQIYIGYTECTLTERCRNHAQNGSILQHNVSQHTQSIITKQILDATEVLHYLPLKVGLIIAEALYIKEESLNLNAQREGEYRVLKILLISVFRNLMASLNFVHITVF